MLPFVLYLLIIAFRWLSYVCVAAIRKFVITELINVRKASCRRVAEQVKHEIRKEGKVSEMKNCLKQG